MSESIKKNLYFFLDKIVQKILAIEDYLCLPTNVHASEILLFALASLWFLWFCLFDVQSSSPVFQFILTEAGWANVFGLFAVMHFVGVFFDLQQLRRLALFGYAVVWFVWLVMVAAAQIASTAAPTIFVVLSLAIYVAVRVSRAEESE